MCTDARMVRFDAGRDLMQGPGSSDDASSE
jgi:hypothetical protein